MYRTHTAVTCTKRAGHPMKESNHRDTRGTTKPHTELLYGAGGASAARAGGGAFLDEGKHFLFCHINHVGYLHGTLYLAA